MAKGTLQDRIHAAEALTRQEPGPALTATVERALADRAALVIAAAARAAAHHRMGELAPELRAAGERLFIDPVERDPQCHGKFAVVRALSALDPDGREHDDLLLRAVRHRQMEPVWGKLEDSAPRLRLAAAEALVRRGHPDLLRVLAELLADPSREVRAAAARVAGELGGERAALLLHLRLRLDDAEAPENLADYATALLLADGAQAVPAVAAQLDPQRPGIGGVALALGGSRLAEALPPLLALLDRPLLPVDLRRDLITAIALQRSEAAGTALLALLDEGTADDARAAAEGLHLYRDRPSLLAAAITAARGDAGLLRRLETGTG